MAEKRHLSWRTENAGTKYPFTERATLTNRDGIGLPEGLFFDAAIYPSGGTRNFYLSRLAVTAREAVVTVGDAATPSLATGTFSPAAPPTVLALEDTAGRPAGVLVSDSVRLVALAAIGNAVFQPTQTEFVPSVCFPRPVTGVTSFVLEDGTVLSGEVWFCGGDGVAITDDGELNVAVGPLCSELSEVATAIAINVVGDPLFRRRLCGGDTYQPPRFVRTLRLTDGTNTYECTPNDGGDIRLVVGDSAADRPTLRITASAGELRISQLVGGGT